MATEMATQRPTKPQVAVDAAGKPVDYSRYMAEQLSLTAKFVSGVLNTGPEQHALDGDTWKAIDLMVHKYEPGRQSALLSKDPHVDYVMNQWRIRFAQISGSLIRRAGMPLETIIHDTEGFQQAIVENIGQLRFLWQQKTGQVLSLHSAIEQIRWKGPELVERRDPDLPPDRVTPEMFFEFSALFPHVVGADSSVDLVFNSEHIAPERLAISIDPNLVGVIQKEIDVYSQF